MLALGAIPPPSNVSRPPRQAREPRVLTRALLRVAHIVPGTRPVRPPQPLARPLRRMHVDHRVGRTDLARTEVVRPAKCRSVPVFRDRALHVRWVRESCSDWAVAVPVAAASECNAEKVGKGPGVHE